ncbi:MAG: adenylate/guanylate cyclase domain-containing protein [Ramlibacter sp.]
MSEAAADVAEGLEGPPSLKRRLAAVAFADVAGYSRLISANDAEAVRRWKALRSDVMEPLIARHGGRVAEIAGDAVLIEFASAVSAVRWATEIQRVQHALEKPSDPFAIHLRIGINVDDVIDDDGILQGDGVNVAARIHQAGRPGQIVITSRVREFLTNRLPLKFRDLGTPPMKNIATPVRVFEIEWLEHGTASSMPPPYLHWTSRPTVAVLPFRNRSAGSDDAYFGEGITDDIITGLSRSRSLYVIARNSTLRYSNREGDSDLRQIAAELDVRYVVDGSVWRQQDRLRIKVELVDVSGNRSLWAQRFEGSGAEIFEFQDRIAASVIGSLEPRLRAAEAARVGDRPTESLDAFDCVLKAMSRLYQFTQESYTESDVLLERAVVLDPGYAQAHAYIAWRLNFVLGENRSDNPAWDRERAHGAAQRALELDPEDPFVLSVAAHIDAFTAKRLELASDMYERALGLDENSAFAWGLSALNCAYLGAPDEALERLQNTWRLNPYDPMNFYYWIVAGIAEFVAGRYGECIAWARKSHRANPRFMAAMRTLAPALALSGDEEGARSVARQLLAIDPGFRVGKFIEWYPLRRNEDLDRLREGLRAAGLPD